MKSHSRYTHSKIGCIHHVDLGATLPLVLVSRFRFALCLSLNLLLPEFVSRSSMSPRRLGRSLLMYHLFPLA